MIPRHLAFELAVLAMLCIVGIFLFPATAGPYSAVHGPASALLSLRARMRLRLSMAFTALNLVLIHRPLTMDWKGSKTPFWVSPFCSLQSDSVLRC
jgi:hypothetical protein